MTQLRDSLFALGLPGLFLIAVIDSAGVPIPGGVDILLMLLAWQRPALVLVVAATAAIGSTLGCLVLYRLGRSGGDVALRRLSPARRQWVTAKVRENDVLAMLVAVLAPAPFPTKPFILMAGLVGMPWRRFVTAVFGGRILRFTAEAYLAVRLGDRAAETIRAHYPTVLVALVVLVGLAILIRRLRAR